MKLKNVIFDLGKVLIDYDFNIFFENLGLQDHKLDISQVVPAIKNFGSGKISRQQFYEHSKILLSHDVNQAKFEAAWRSIFSEIPEMIELARRISEEYQVYLLSNTDEIHFPYIWDNFSKLHFFQDNLMLSYKLKAIKPDSKIYHRGLEKFSLNPEECLFIDDKAENVEAAIHLGLKAIQFKDYNSTKLFIDKSLTI